MPLNTVLKLEATDLDYYSVPVRKVIGVFAVQWLSYVKQKIFSDTSTLEKRI